MELNTASEVISFAKKLEEDQAKLYNELAEQHSENRETWLSFAKENKKNVVQIERAYYGVISDTIEGCFSFKINPEEYVLDAELAKNAEYSDVLNKAVVMEEKIIKFYSDAAEQSKSLMADVPRAFAMVAKKRGDRRAKLESFLHREG